jgi:PhzF family phenazine biosynthesis protein
MKIKQYQVDAFATRAFTGNPAAVCPLESWPSDELLQAIAEENNLSETAFFVPSENCAGSRPLRKLISAATQPWQRLM